MNETVFTIATAFISFIIPVALAKFFSRRNKTGRVYDPGNGQYLNRTKRFVIFVGTVLASIFIIEPLISLGLHDWCLGSPCSEWVLLLIGIIANYVLIDYLS
jgi:hypothetical protein